MFKQLLDVIYLFQRARVLLTQHGWSHSGSPLYYFSKRTWRRGGSLSKGMVTGSISEFIKQLTCSHQYLFIITRFSGWSRCRSEWPSYTLVTDNSLCLSNFTVQNIWYTEKTISPSHAAAWEIRGLPLITLWVLYTLHLNKAWCRICFSFTWRVKNLKQIHLTFAWCFMLCATPSLCH